MEGECKVWHTNGHLWERKFYRKGNVIEYERWYNHDQIAEMTILCEDIHETKWWKITGQLWKHEIFRDIICENKEWYENGLIRQHTITDNKRSIRCCKYWYENGILNSYESHRAGLREGEQKYWFSTGRMICRVFSSRNLHRSRIYTFKEDDFIGSKTTIIIPFHTQPSKNPEIISY